MKTRSRWLAAATRWAIGCCVLAALAVPAPAQSLGGLGGDSEDPLRVSLVADVAQVRAGEPFYLGVQLQLDKGWHTYWHNPKDGGDPPRIDWQLPEGFAIGPLVWPLPKRTVEPGDLVSYGYTNQVILQALVTPPEEITATATLQFHAKVTWQACDEVCVYGTESVTLVVPHGGASLASPAQGKLAAARAAAPRPIPSFLHNVDARWQPATAKRGVVRAGTWTVRFETAKSQYELQRVFPHAITEGAISEPTITSSASGWTATFAIDGLSAKFTPEQLGALFVLCAKNSDKPAAPISFVVTGVTAEKPPTNDTEQPKPVVKPKNASANGEARERKNR